MSLSQKIRSLRVTKATSVNICVSELFANIQFVFVGCWVSSSGTLRPFGSERIVWCLFFANRIVDYTSICTLFSFVFLCSLVGFVAIVSKADNYISLSSSIHILSISSQPFNLFFYLYMPLLSILTSLTPLLTFL